MKKVLSPVCRFVIVFCHPPCGENSGIDRLRPTCFNDLQRGRSYDEL